VKHKAAVTDGIAVGQKPYHVIATDMRFVIHRILLPCFALVNAVRLKMLRNPVFLSIAYRAYNACNIFRANHFVPVSVSQILNKDFFAKGCIAFGAIPNQFMAATIIVNVIVLIAGITKMTYDCITA